MNLLCRLFGHKWEWKSGNTYHGSTHCNRCNMPRIDEKMAEMILKIK